MNSAYPPPDMPQHRGMGPPPPSYQQPPPQHSMSPSGTTMHTYQQQQHLHLQQPLPPPPIQNTHTQPHPSHPHSHPHQQHPPRQQPPQPPPPTAPTSNMPPPPDESTSARHVSTEEYPQNQQQLVPVSRVEDGSGRRYHLDVMQQPQRARMCGYGDKDRRPITPPPCVRLVIIDVATGEEVSCKDVDYSLFVLNVDLWDEHGAAEVNLCRQPPSTGGPAIPATPGYSYPPLNGADPAPVPYSPQVLSSSRDPSYAQPPPMPYVQDYQVPAGYTQTPPSYPPTGTYGPPQQYFPQHQAYRPDQSVAPLPSQRYDPSTGYVEGSGPSVAYVHDQYKGALNRNLIGSVAASAFCLTDTSDREGVWFVLQDLSVRLEGAYRLKFSFVNVGNPGAGSRDRPSSSVNKGRAPILASCFSDKFDVYSAKKFPGVCESTPLSKTFAGQGIKIPIRKDGNRGGDDDFD